jgi:AAA domain
VDSESLALIKKVWRHSGVTGSVWMPHIYKIGQDGQKFREGAVIKARNPEFPDMRDSVDWYWTPAISSSASRKAKSYPGQRAVWVDCDESYDDKLLQSLRPSYMWETSPGHKQAIWLMNDVIERSEFHRDGFIGMLTQALGGDKSGVDIGQLLRVPATIHHKRAPYQGKILRSTGQVYTRGQLLTRVAKGLGFSPGLASELGADDPYGDRSKVIWRFARNAAELGISQDLTFKLIKATKWNKWKDEPDRLKEDIARAYEQQPAAQQKDPEREQANEQLTAHEDNEPVEAWGMATVDAFGPVIRKPVSWVVPGIIPEGGCGLLVSAPKVGKTRIAIEMALGLATGRKPLGISMKSPLAVGFFSLEDGEYLFSSRLNGSLNTDQGRFKYHWEGHINTDLSWAPPEPMSLFTNFSQIDLSEDVDKQRLYETITKYELKLVIIDTLSMAIGKSDVSNSKDMYAILKDIKTIAKATGCAIMFIHHTRKRVFEKGESIQEMVLGSTALHAWSDFIMNLVAPAEDGDMLRLGVQTKMGNNQHFINDQLKIIKKPAEEVVV